MEPIVVDLSAIRPLTDEELFQLWVSNKNVRIERTSSGELLFMTPSGFRSSLQSGRVFAALFAWNEKLAKGYVTNASGGYLLPDGAMRAPDAAWVARERVDRLPPEQLKRFLPLCPDFVVEVMSETDRLDYMKSKMDEWMKNGCRLGWLIDPSEEQVSIYRAGAEVEAVEGFDQVLSGEPVLSGFEFSLAELRRT